MILESLTRAFVDPSAAVYAAALGGEQTPVAANGV